MHCFGCNSELVTESRICKTCGRPVETDPDRYFKAGMEASAAGDLDRSIKHLTDCVNLDPDHLSGRYNLGIALALANRCDEAMEHYYAVADQEPNYPSIYTALGQAAFGSYMTHTAEAESGRKMMIHMLMKAIEQDPEDVDACFSLANAYGEGFAVAETRADPASRFIRDILRHRKSLQNTSKISGSRHYGAEIHAAFRPQ